MAKDKADLKTLRDQKKDDKSRGDQKAVRADRKAVRKGDAKRMKDGVKKGAAKVKKTL